MFKIKSISFIISVLVMSFLIGYFVFAWQEPQPIGVTPPEGNVSAPLNVSGTAQAKAGGLILNTGGAATGLIVQNGNVGIGTTGPGYKLDVSGTGRFTSTLYANSNLYVSGIQQISKNAHTSGASAYHLELYSPDTGDSSNEVSLRFHQGGRYWYQIRARAEGFRFTAGSTDSLAHITAQNGIFMGNVGIGITSPAQRLHSTGYIRADSGFCIGTNCITSWPSGTALPTGASGQTLRHTGTDWVANSIIFNNGTNVGINTSSPTYRLDVSGNARVTTYLGVGGAPSTNTRVYAYSGAAYGVYALGSTMGGRFEDSDGTARTYLAYSDYGIYQDLGARNYFSGNVGIGTTSPAQRLHSTGYIRADSGFCIGTNCITSWPSGGGLQCTQRTSYSTAPANSTFSLDGGYCLSGTEAATGGGFWITTGGNNTVKILQSHYRNSMQWYCNFINTGSWAVDVSCSTNCCRIN